MQHQQANGRPRNNPFVRPRGESRPIHKLPIELLSRIFEFRAARVNRPLLYELRKDSKYQHLEQDAGEERPTIVGFNPRFFRVTVSHVCRLWRNVAISTASLWTVIDAHTNIMITSRALPYELVSLHLERSKSLPLDITVRDHSSNHEMTSSDAKFLYALLIPHVNRWRSIELEHIGSPHMSAFLDAVSDPSTPPASQLESLRISHFYDSEVHFPRTRWSEFPTFFNGSAPRLRDLLLFQVHVEWSQTWISAASNLTSLELLCHLQSTQPSWAAFATILRGAPRLQKLALHHSGPSGPPEDWVLGQPTATGAAIDVNSPIPLLHLTEFILGSQPEDVAIALLHKLYMPALKTLILDLKDGDYSNFVDELTGPATSLIPCSTEDAPSSLLVHLEQFAILNLPCVREESMRVMFEQLDTLKALRLALGDNSNSDPPGTPFFLEILIPVTLPGQDVVYRVPRLEKLLVCPSRGNLPFLCDLVQKRMEAGVPLKSLYLSGDESLTSDRLAWFRERLEACWPTSPVHCMNEDVAFEGYW